MKATKIKTKGGKRNTGMFYALLKQLPNYDPQYSEVIKEGVVEEFTSRVRPHRPTGSLSALSDTEYARLLAELRTNIECNTTKAMVVEKDTRRHFTHKILLKLGELGVSTRTGYTEVNSHIEQLKGWGGRLIPEITTEEFPAFYKAVCSYVDWAIDRQKKERAISKLN